MQSLDLLGLQRDRRIAPTEADVRMMAFSFREFTNLLNKGKCLPEIAEAEAPLDAMSFLQQLPVWCLCVKELSLLAREWRNCPATGSTGFASKSFGHVACPSQVAAAGHTKVPMRSIRSYSGQHVVQGVAHRGLLLRVERAHGAHQSFERIARNHFMTFVRQAQSNASPIRLRSLSDQVPTCLKRLDGL